MRAKFTNSLNDVRIASPCSANWEEMFGDERRRFCGDCKLNVYNLSGMSQTEAENLILQSEGKLCVRFFRRADGSVLTKDCPVGWQMIKRKVSKTAAAFASLVFAILSGVGFANYFAKSEAQTMGTIAVTPGNFTTDEFEINDLNTEIKGKPVIVGEIYNPSGDKNIPVAGGLTNIDDVRQNIKQKRGR